MCVCIYIYLMLVEHELSEPFSMCMYICIFIPKAFFCVWVVGWGVLFHFRGSFTDSLGYFYQSSQSNIRFAMVHMNRMLDRDDW